MPTKGVAPVRSISSSISEQVRRICSKLEQGETLSQVELDHEVTNAEAAYLLSVIAGRTVSHRYLAQLTRDDGKHKRRLTPFRVVGNSYTYQVEALLGIRFIKLKKAEEEKQDEYIPLRTE